MHGKIMFVVGAAVGYVVGTRHGREGMEKVKQQVKEFWENPKVQKTVSDAQRMAEEKVPAVGAVKDAVGGNKSGSGSTGSSGSGSSSSGSSTSSSSGSSSASGGASGGSASGTSGSGSSGNV